MAGVGKLLKQAQKMQKQMEAAQEKLAEHSIQVSQAGGAVVVHVNGQGYFESVVVDPEFLKEDKETVENTILEAFRSASEQAKAYSDEQMEQITGGSGGIPGLPGLM